MREHNESDQLRRHIIPPASPRATVSPAGQGEESPEELRSDIEGTRAELDATVDAIQDRLSPEYLKAQAKDVVRDAADQAKAIIHDATEQAKEIVHEAVHDATEQTKEAVHDATVGKAEEAVSGATRAARGVSATMIETIKQNPVPAALVGIGLGWMFFKHQSSSNDMQTAPSRYRDEWTGSGSYRTGRPFVQGPARYDTSRHNGHGTTTYGSDQGGASAPQIFDRVQDSAGQFADQAQDKAGQMADRVQGTAGQLMDQAQGMAGQAQETAGQIVDTVQERTQQVTGTLQEQFQSMLRERPLILGGLAVAAGLAVGLAIPATEK